MTACVCSQHMVTGGMKTAQLKLFQINVFSRAQWFSLGRHEFWGLGVSGLWQDNGLRWVMLSELGGGGMIL